MIMIGRVIGFALFLSREIIRLLHVSHICYKMNSNVCDRQIFSWMFKKLILISQYFHLHKCNALHTWFFYLVIWNVYACCGWMNVLLCRKSRLGMCVENHENNWWVESMKHINFILYGVNHSNLKIYIYICE